MLGKQEKMQIEKPDGTIALKFPLYLAMMSLSWQLSGTSLKQTWPKYKKLT